jgi:DNA-binding MarR family transcriptional regulator
MTQTPSGQPMATNKKRDLRSLLSIPHFHLQSQMNERMERKGLPTLRPVQHQLLALIEVSGMRMADLVTMLGLAKQTVSDLVNDLESIKMVERFADPDHGVIKRVRLGVKGKAWAAEQRKVSDATETQWESLIGKGKMKTLRGLLEDLASAEESAAKK